MKPACLLAFELDTRPKQPTQVQLPAPKSERSYAPLCLPPAPPPPPPAEAQVRDLPSLSHIAHILRLQKYQKRHRQQVQSQLRALQEASARTVRLTSVARSIQRTLAECIRSEDKSSFTTLLNAFHEAQDDCHRLAAEPAASGWNNPEYSFRCPDTFLDRLPEASRTSILSLLAAVRYDGDFIADRLASLSREEVLSLLPDRGTVRSAESVFASSSGPYSRTSRYLGFAVDGQTELIASQSFPSALDTLILCVRGACEGSLTDDARALEVWSTVCARVITGQIPGSEKLVPSVLDAWASSATWPGKERLGLWILQILQSGSFLIEQPSKQSYRIRVQGRPETSAEDAIRTETFYTQATNELLDLLADPEGPSVIPEAVLRMCRAIWMKLQRHAGHQRAFPHFILTRWLFSPFFAEAISLPEAFGLVADSYVSDSARHRILREVANRAQKAIFDVAYSWKYGNIVPARTAQRVQAIMSRFQGPPSDSQSSLRPDRGLDGMAPQKQASCLTISASDILVVVKALYPRRRPASFASKADTIHSGLKSSASSISGFSLFKHSGSLEMPAVLPPSWPQDASESVRLGPDGPFLPSAGPKRTEEWDRRPTDVEVDFEQVWQACASINDTPISDVMHVDQWATLTVVPGAQSLQGLNGQHGTSIEDMDGPAIDTNKRAAVILEVVEQVLPAWPEHDGSAQDIPALEFHVRLVQMLEARVRSAEEVSDFIAAHDWFQKLQFIRSLLTQDPRLESLHAAIEAIQRLAQRSLKSDEQIIATCEGWSHLVKPALARYHGELSTLAGALDRMRDKMWFVADVRTSAAYDAARSVAGALRIMGRSKRPIRTRMAPPLRHWSGSKFSNTSMHLKTEAQTLELLSALPDQGGPNKLSDDQARSTLLWMESNNIENLCRGEERLHRLCMEVRKCVEQLVSSESALIYSNPLFARHPHSSQSAGHPASLSSLSALQSTAGRLSHLTLQTNVAPSIESLSSASNGLSSVSSRDYVESRSPTLTHRSSVPFWSPAMTEEQSPSSATSIGSYHTQMASRSRIGTQTRRVKMSDSGWLEQLKRSLTSLLLSDLTSTLLNDGSETDQALWTGIGGELVDKHLRNLYLIEGATKTTYASPSVGISTDGAIGFDYDQAFRRCLRFFSASSDPSIKLSMLHDIDRLMCLQAKDEQGSALPSNQTMPVVEISSNTLRHHARFPKAEDNVSRFCRLLSDADVRPKAIYRDLQYIAALVPATVLESTPQGKAFWNAAIATSQMKQDARSIMVETADSIIAYHSNNRGHGRTSSTAQQQRDSATFTAPSRTSSAEDIARYSMADAAYLLQVTAKEGDPVAQRELATLYLTHPELMDHIIAPFARPSDVFKEELESKWRKNQDPNRCDPATMCVAHHWMSLSSKGGDALAKEYLRQREEMERLP